MSALGQSRLIVTAPAVTASPERKYVPDVPDEGAPAEAGLDSFPFGVFLLLAFLRDWDVTGRPDRSHL